MHEYRPWRRVLAAAAFGWSLLCAIWPVWLAVGAYCCCLPIAVAGLAQIVVLVDCITARPVRPGAASRDQPILPLHVRRPVEIDFLLALVGAVSLVVAFWRVKRCI
jgi:hypothetical protein